MDPGRVCAYLHMYSVQFAYLCIVIALLFPFDAEFCLANKSAVCGAFQVPLRSHNAYFKQILLIFCSTARTEKKKPIKR